MPEDALNHLRLRVGTRSSTSGRVRDRSFFNVSTNSAPLTAGLDSVTSTADTHVRGSSNANRRRGGLHPHVPRRPASATVTAPRPAPNLLKTLTQTIGHQLAPHDSGLPGPTESPLAAPVDSFSVTGP